MIFTSCSVQIRTELHRLVGGDHFGSTIVVTDALVNLCDLCHFLIGQGKIKDIEVVADMIRILGAGDHHIAALDVPAENDLCGALAVLGAKLGKDGLPGQGLVAVA